MSFSRYCNTSIFGSFKFVVLRRLKCFSFRRLNCVILGDWNMSFSRYCNTSIFGSFKFVVLRRLKCFSFRRLNCVILGDWNMSFSRYYNISEDWNLSFREIKLAIFEKLKSSFFGGLNMTFSGDWNITFSGNETFKLSSFWKTESFIFFGRNHAYKKKWKSEPKTNCESKHSWGTTNVDRICHEIQSAS